MLIRLGSNWGGWTIEDSLIQPEDLILSGGIECDTSFEEALLQRVKVRFLGIDPTNSSLKHSSKLKEPLKSRFTFIQKAISSSSSDIYTPYDSREKCSSIGLKNLIDFNDFTLIKLDIEGGEYEALNSVSNFRNIKQIAVEFHHWVPYCNKTLQDTYDTIKHLNSNGYKLVFHKVNVPSRKIQECLFIESQLTQLPEITL